MKKLFILGLCLLCFGLFAQNQNALLYKISGNGITKPSYIFGTIHLSCDVKLEEATLKALKETSQLYLELDMDDAELQTKMMQSVVMKNGAKISSLIPTDDFNILNKFTSSKLNIPAVALDSYKPFFIISMFSATLFDCAPKSIESELVKYAQSSNEPIYGLESVEEQMSLFDEIPYQLQAEELMRSVKSDFKEDKLEMDLLTKAYFLRDLNEMQRLISTSSSVIATKYYDLLVKNRNKNWLLQIERISKEKATFYGVGAAHLLGNDGIIHLLVRNGYQVEAVKN